MRSLFFRAQARRFFFVSATSLALAAGCGSSSSPTDTTEDSGVGADTAVADSSPHDTAADSGTPDSGNADSGNADTASSDTAKADTAPSDTATSDTARSDTATSDTPSADTTVADTATTDTTTTDSATADTTPDAPVETGPTLDAACNSWAANLCSHYDTCSTFFLKYVFGDIPTCKTRVKISCVDLLGAPGSNYTPSSIITCGNSYTTQSCTDFLSNRVTSECSVVGSYINGHACGANAQCSSGFCHVSPGTTCGLCAAAPVLRAACMDGQCAEGVDCGGY